MPNRFIRLSGILPLLLLSACLGAVIRDPSRTALDRSRDPDASVYTRADSSALVSSGAGTSNPQPGKTTKGTPTSKKLVLGHTYVPYSDPHDPPEPELLTTDGKYVPAPKNIRVLYLGSKKAEEIPGRVYVVAWDLPSSSSPETSNRGLAWYSFRRLNVADKLKEAHKNKLLVWATIKPEHLDISTGVKVMTPREADELKQGLRERVEKLVPAMRELTEDDLKPKESVLVPGKSIQVLMSDGTHRRLENKDRRIMRLRKNGTPYRYALMWHTQNAPQSLKKACAFSGRGYKMGSTSFAPVEIDKGSRLKKPVKFHEEFLLERFIHEMEAHLGVAESPSADADGDSYISTDADVMSEEEESGGEPALTRKRKSNYASSSAKRTKTALSQDQLSKGEVYKVPTADFRALKTNGKYLVVQGSDRLIVSLGKDAAPYSLAMVQRLRLSPEAKDLCLYPGSGGADVGRIALTPVVAFEESEFTPTKHKLINVDDFINDINPPGSFLGPIRIELEGQ